MIKKLVMVALAVMTTLLALVVGWQFRIVVINVLISLALAATVRPLFNRLVGKALKIRLIWILAYLIALVGLGFLLFLTNQAAVNEIQKLAKTVAVQDIWLLPVWLKNVTFFQFLVTRLPAPSFLFETVTGKEGQFVLPTLLIITQGVGEIVSSAIVIFILSIYWSINQRHFELLWLSLLPSNQRKQARDIWQMIESNIGAYIRGQGILSFLVGLLLGVGYWLLGFPYPALLGLISVLGFLIPVAGLTVIVLAPLFIGLLTSIELGIIAVLYALVVLIVVGTWVNPRLIKSQRNDPILTLVLLIALASVFGLVGLIVAPPISIVCQILWNRLVSHNRSLKTASQISDLRERQERLRLTILAMDEPPPPLVSSGMERLIQLIEKAEPILETVQPVKDGSTHRE